MSIFSLFLGLLAPNLHGRRGQMACVRIYGQNLSDVAIAYVAYVEMVAKSRKSTNFAAPPSENASVDFRFRYNNTPRGSSPIQRHHDDEDPFTGSASRWRTVRALFEQEPYGRVYNVEKDEQRSCFAAASLLHTRRDRSRLSQAR